MRSATDFLPWLMSTLTNFATSLFEYFGSGRISRFEISLRRGIQLSAAKSTNLLFADQFCIESRAEPDDSMDKIQRKIKRPWAFSRRTSTVTACDPLRRRYRARREPCGRARPADPLR